MISFTVIAIDEFGRKYGNRYVSIHRFEEEFELNPNWVYQWHFRNLVEPMLRRMGTDAKAEWECRMEMLDWYENRD